MCQAEGADVFVNQNVDGEDREELLSLQQRLQSKIQVCTAVELEPHSLD